MYIRRNESIAKKINVALLQLPRGSMCTGIRALIEGINKNEFFARTMEFGVDLKSRIVVKPAGTQQVADINEKEGKRWVSNYNYFGIDALNSGHLVEGSNEKGLYVGGFYSPDYAHYPEATEVSNSIGPLDFVDWCLSSFADVDSMQLGLQNNDAALVNANFAPLAKEMGADYFAPPMHWIAVDKSGKSIVVEYTKKGRNIYPNPYGVITNAPDFEWMQTNVQNYANLSKFNVLTGTDEANPDEKAAEVFGVPLLGFGQGTGMLVSAA